MPPANGNVIEGIFFSPPDRRLRYVNCTCGPADLPRFPPLDKLFFKLKRNGCAIAGATAQYDRMLAVMETMNWLLGALRTLFAKLEGMSIHVRPA